MVILVSFGAWQSQVPHPSAATAGDNELSIGALKYRFANLRRRLALFIRGSASQSDLARSSTRGALDDDNFFPRGGDRLRIHAAGELGVRANHRAGHSRASGDAGTENGPCGKESRETAHRGLARMLETSRRQRASRQGAQEIPFRMQEGGG